MRALGQQFLLHRNPALGRLRAAVDVGERSGEIKVPWESLICFVQDALAAWVVIGSSQGAPVKSEYRHKGNGRVRLPRLFPGAKTFRRTRSRCICKSAVQASMLGGREQIQRCKRAMNREKSL